MDAVLAGIFANQTLGWALFLVTLVGGAALLFLGFIYTKWQVEALVAAANLRAEDYKGLLEKSEKTNEKLLDTLSAVKPVAESTARVVDSLNEVKP